MQRHVLWSNCNGCWDPTRDRSIFQVQYATGTNRRANPTTNTGRPYDILTSLSVPPNIDSHFTISATVPTWDALPTICGDSKARFESLNKAKVSCQRTSKAAPNSVAHQRVESSPNNAGKNSSNKETIRLTQISVGAETKYLICSSNKIVNHCASHQYCKSQDSMNQPSLNLPGFQSLIRQLTKWVTCGLGKSTAAAYPAAVPSLSEQVSK